MQHFSVILEKNFPDHVLYKPNNWEFERNSSKYQKKRLNSIIGFFKKYFFKFIDKGYRSETVLYLTLFSNKDLTKLFFKSFFKIAPIINATTSEVQAEVNPAMRNRIEEYTTNNYFADSILFSAVRYFFPIELLEGYSAINNEVNLIIKKNIPKSIFTGAGWIWNTQFAIWASKCSQLGTKLFGVQHGGTYGEVEHLEGELLERKFSDFFITWGWKENKKTIPLPAPRLGLNIDNTVKKEHILWVTTADSRFNYFVGNIVFGNRFLKYFEHQHSLFNSLSEEVQLKIRVRLYPTDFGWKLKERWIKACPNVQFAISTEPYIEQAQKARIVIIDHIGGTTTLQALGLKTPIVIIPNWSLYTIREKALNYYNDLKNEKILFDNYTEGANFLNNISDVEKRWNKKSKQKILKKYSINFALKKDNYIDIWLKFISNI